MPTAVIRKDVFDIPWRNSALPDTDAHASRRRAQATRGSALVLLFGAACVMAHPVDMFIRQAPRDIARHEDDDDCEDTSGYWETSGRGVACQPI